MSEAQPIRFNITGLNQVSCTYKDEEVVRFTGIQKIWLKDIGDIESVLVLTSKLLLKGKVLFIAFQYKQRTRFIILEAAPLKSELKRIVISTPYQIGGAYIFRYQDDLNHLLQINAFWETTYSRTEPVKLFQYKRDFLEDSGTMLHNMYSRGPGFILTNRSTKDLKSFYNLIQLIFYQVTGDKLFINYIFRQILHLLTGIHLADEFSFSTFR